MKMTSGAPRALAGALKREQGQNHAENIICYCPEVAEPPAGRRGRARGCRGRCAPEAAGWGLGGLRAVASDVFGMILPLLALQGAR